MQFYKYEATGNDFIIFKNIVKNPSKIARAICHRRFGFGADGILFPEKSLVADIKMNYYNSDGSLAYMCGNGIRAFSKFLLDEKIINKDNFTIETEAGIIKVSVIDNLISANLGKPITTLEKPFVKEKVVSLKPINLNNYLSYIINTGVLHTVILKKDYPNFDIINDAKLIQDNPLFINSTNVNLVEVLSDGTIKVDTYERGAGLTLSCGTGVVAAYYIAHKLNLLKNNEGKVIVAGGNLLVKIINDELYLIGPANKIGSGIYEEKN